jgi:hypothetical protein
MWIAVSGFPAEYFDMGIKYDFIFSNYHIIISNNAATTQICRTIISFID